MDVGVMVLDDGLPLQVVYGSQIVISNFLAIDLGREQHYKVSRSVVFLLLLSIFSAPYPRGLLLFSHGRSTSGIPLSIVLVLIWFNFPPIFSLG